MFNFKVETTDDHADVKVGKPFTRTFPPVSDVIIRVNNIDVPINLIPIGTTPPPNPAIGQLWIDTGDIV